MFKYLKIRKNFKKTKNFEQLVNKNFLTINNFNLKKIYNSILNCNEIFLDNFIFLNENKIDIDLIKNSYTLFKNLDKIVNDKLDDYINNNYTDDNILNKQNILVINEPEFVKKISLNIKNFFIDKYYNFEIIIEGINEKKEFIKIKKRIFPINYSGNYIEPLIYKENFTSLFEIENEKISFLDIIDNVKKEINYEINELNHIVVDKNNFFNEQTYVSYFPNQENFKIKCDLFVTKIYLNTDYKSDNIKKIIFEKE